MTLDAVLLRPALATIQALLDDPSITEIMVVDGGRRTFIERAGWLQEVPLTWPEADLLRALKTLGTRVNVAMDASSPLLEMRLPDGSRLSAAVPPCAAGGPVLTIRKFSQRFTLDELFARGAVTEQEYFALFSAIHKRKNIIVSGGTGAGKTTILNALGSLIDPSRRVVLVEDVPEIVFQGEDSPDSGLRPHLVRLQTAKEQRSSVVEDQADSIQIHSLIEFALRQRPDVLILGEFRTPAAAFQLLQVFNSGHPGSMSTMHANSPKDALSRFAQLLIASGIGLSLADAKNAVVAVVDLIVQIDRTPRGRAVTQILSLEDIRHA